MNMRNGEYGLYCSRAWGWKASTYCTRGRWTRWHFGKHRDANGRRF